MNYYNKIFYLLLLLIILISFPLYSQLTPGSFVEYSQGRSTVHLIEDFPEYYSYINWSDGVLITEYAIPITFQDRNIGRNMMNLTEKLKQKIIFFTSKVIAEIQVSSISKLGNYFQENEQIRFELLSKLYFLSVETPTIKGSMLSGKISFPLFGPNSVSDFLYKNVKSIKVENFLKKEAVDIEYYDTLIIDMIMFPQFQPSLMPKILNQKGEIIHSIDTVDQEILKKQTAVHYVTSITEALNHPVRGQKVAYVLPHSISGVFLSDIVLFDSDVQNIYAQQRTIDNLYLGKVIIVKPKETI